MNTESPFQNDWRNRHKIPCARLRTTEDLTKRLPLLGEVLEEPKYDGHRYTLEVGRGLPPAFISRGKVQGRKGSEASKDSPYLSREIPEWVTRLESLPMRVVFDGELVGMNEAGDSAGSLAGRDDIEPTYIVFDVLYVDGDIRHKALRRRLEERDRLMKLIRFMGLEERDIKSSTGVVRSVFTLADLTALLQRAIDEKVEGFVLKLLSSQWDKNWYGYKVKPRQSHDGIVIGVKAAKKHHLGTVTKTTDVGVLIVAQYMEDTEAPRAVAYVNCNPGVPMSAASSLIGEVVEFESVGWDAVNKQWRFPTFVGFRTDKPPEDCTWEGARLVDPARPE